MSNFSRIKKKWMTYAPKGWWGDHIDVRFHLIREFNKLKGKSILDVGCGAGILLSEIKGPGTKIGIDISLEALKIAKKINPNANFLLTDIRRLPIKNNAVEIISAANVIPGADYKIENPDLSQKKFTTEIHRILKEDGILILTTPNRAWYKRPAKMSYEELNELLRPFFKIKIRGYNPFPKFPYFLPTRILVKIPFMDTLLKFLMNISFFKKRGKFFYVEATKI